MADITGFSQKIEYVLFDMDGKLLLLLCFPIRILIGNTRLDDRLRENLHRRDESVSRCAPEVTD